MKLKNIALSGLAIGLATISTAGFTKMTAPVNDISVTVGCPVLVVCRVTYNSKSKWLNARGQGKIVKFDCWKMGTD